MTEPWDPEFLERSPIFAPLRVYAPARFPARWPDLAELQQLLAGRHPPVRSAGGALIRLVPQGPKPRRLEDRYEPRTFLDGELQIRARSWHDLFNLLVWLAFPRAKAALNERHYRALLEQQAAGAANRGPAQDALTLFDEGGIIATSDDEKLVSMICDFRWKELFWENRGRVRAHMRFYVFGHALYEKVLPPITGRVETWSRGRRDAEQGPQSIGDATVIPARGASSMPAPGAFQGSDPKRSHSRPSTRPALRRCDGRGAREPTVSPDAPQPASGSYLPPQRQALLRRPSATGRAILLHVAPGWLRNSLPGQLAALDAQIAAQVSNPVILAGTRGLAPVPILGVPGWCAGNEREDFYDDVDYFRPGRRAENAMQKAEG